MVFFNNKYRNSLIPDTKTEPRAKGASTYKKTQKKRICVKTMAVKKLGRKMSGPQGSCHPLSVLLINSKKNQSSRSQSFAKGNISEGTPNISVKVITRNKC